MSEWKKVKIGEIFKIEKGSLQSSKCIPGKYDFITAASEWKTHESYSHECEAIVYAVAASGSLGRAHYVNGKFIASDLCFILTEKDKEKYPINFQFYQLIFELIREEIVSKTKTGTSKESINQKNFSNYEIPYFSFDYQMANYEKLVNTKQKISELLEESEKQKVYVKQLRQNILQEAIEGKLTEEWRKENPVVKGNPDFDAEALFEKIQEEKCHTDSELLRNSKKKKVFEPIAENEQENFESKYKTNKNGWCISLLDNFVKLKIGGTPSRNNSNYWLPEIPWVSSGEVANCEIFTTKEKISFDGSKNSAAKLLPKGTVLIAMIGQGKTRGQAAILRIEATTNQNVCALILPKQFILSEYVYMYLCARYEESRKVATGGNQAALSGTKISKFIFSLPPLAEQKEIVSRVEKLLANVTELEEQITERETLTKQLMQSIMKDAFREG